jgi:hypothetical protein
VKAVFRRTVILGLFGTLACGLVALPAAAIGTQPITAVRSSATPGTDPEFSPLEPFGGKIDDLGQSQYPSVYAGDQLSSGELDVYIVQSPQDGTFLNAITAINKENLPYRITYVKHSYADLAQTSQWIKTNRSKLVSQGITPEFWGPDAASNTMQVSLLQPTSTQLSALGAESKYAVTSSNYSAAVQTLMEREVPSAGPVTISPRFLAVPISAEDWNNDSTPFVGADRIITPNPDGTSSMECTSNFFLREPLTRIIAGWSLPPTAASFGRGTRFIHVTQARLESAIMLWGQFLLPTMSPVTTISKP